VLSHFGNVPTDWLVEMCRIILNYLTQGGMEFEPGC
jgi:hypothetical protein